MTKRLAVIVIFLLAGCGSDQEQTPIPPPTRPPAELFTWDDPGKPPGNVSADFADCTAQIEKDPAYANSPPGLAILSAYIKCMQPKGWKFVNPDTAQP